MASYNSYFLMETKDVPAYVQDKLSYFPQDAALTCQEIGDGQLSHIFRLSDKDGKTLIVKQADPQLLRLTRNNCLAQAKDRGPIEENILQLQQALCPGQVPEVYLCDGNMFAMIMDGMAGHELMEEGLMAHKTYPAFADQITDFLLQTLFYTSDITMNHTEKKKLVSSFANPELCDITENLVLGEPVLDYNCRNDIFPPTEAFVKDQIYGDGQLRTQVADLRFHFMNCPQALIHGALHSGSIFVNQDHTMVFNPEFAFFGPMGYDLGNVIASLCLAWANGNATIDDPSDRAYFCGWCMCTILEVVDLFKKKFSKAYASKAIDPLADSPGFPEAYLEAVMADAAGYAGTECLRRIIGQNHSKAISLIEDPDKRIQAEKIILTLGKDLILHRTSFTDASVYMDAMERAIHQVDPQNQTIGPKKTILDFDTVNLDDYSHSLVIIDQTKLPSRIEILSLTKQEDIWEAIYQLKVRGAPAIGVTAAIGIYLAARDIAGELEAKQTAGQEAEDTASFEAFYRKYQAASEYLNSSRPTAVNLSWALARMDRIVQAHKDQPLSDIVKALHDEAITIRDEDIQVCRSIGRYGLSLVKPGDGLLTHCNAGQLATVKYGTATAPMYLGHEQGYDFKIYCDETRPLLQGARLTSFELSSAGMDVTVLCDNMSASLMRTGAINAVFVGCDRVAANGDTANKIGTSGVAVLARHYGVPFYVCAPTSTIDLSIPDGEGIVIEQRKGREISSMWYEKPMVPEGVKTYNPAFDVTDADLITGIVTEFGIAYPPYDQSLKDMFLRKEIKQTVEQIAAQMDC